MPQEMGLAATLPKQQSFPMRRQDVLPQKKTYPLITLHCSFPLDTLYSSIRLIAVSYYYFHLAGFKS